MPTDPQRFRLAGGLALLLLAAVVLYAAHVLGGHAWFSFYGPLVALGLTIAVVMLLRLNHRGAGFVLCAALLCLLVVPEWLEGELAAGHALSWRTLESHGATTMLAVGVACAMAALWEASRLLTLIWPR